MAGKKFKAAAQKLMQQKNILSKTVLN